MLNFVKNYMEKLFIWFEEFVSPEEAGNLNVRPLFGLFMLGGFLVVSVFVFDLVLTVMHPAKDWHGAFGDFFGGIVNPILTFLSFMGLLITIVMQRVELRETRRELEKSAKALEEQSSHFKLQNFESSFFKMIEIQRSCVASMAFGSVSGRRAFSGFCKTLNSFLVRENVNLSSRKAQHELVDELRIKNGWRSFWDQYQLEVSNYFSNLMVLIRFLDGWQESDRVYIEILRSQFCDEERVLLLYYGIYHGGYIGQSIIRLGLVEGLNLNKLAFQKDTSLLK